MTDWDLLEREVRNDCEADVELAESRPLAYGSSIAWVECSYGKTDGLSSLHRVKTRMLTMCDHEIPGAKMRLILTPAIEKVLPRCRTCIAIAALRTQSERGASA